MARSFQIVIEELPVNTIIPSGFGCKLSSNLNRSMSPWKGIDWVIPFSETKTKRSWSVSLNKCMSRLFFSRQDFLCCEDDILYTEAVFNQELIGFSTFAEAIIDCYEFLWSGLVS